VLAGTDAGMVAHGLVAHEVLLPEAADIALGGALGRARLPRRAAMVASAPANLVAFAADPRAEPHILDKPVFVVLNSDVVLN
jgi:hypothetical protein